ncbi:MAG: response regulator [Acidobacteriota bacterium]
MLSTIIISPEEMFRENIREILESSDQIEVRAELNNFYSAIDSWIFDEIKSMEPDIIVVDLSPDKEQGILTIEKISEISKHSHIFVSGDSTDADMILRSMRAGAKEFLPKPVETQTLFAAIERVSKVHAIVNKEKRRYGKLYTFFSAKGGTGSTVISTNFAVNLVEQTKKPTILVDLDLQLGEVSLFLGIKPSFNIIDVADNIHRMDDALLKGFIKKHNSGLDVLAAPDSLDKVDAVSASQIGQILQFLRNSYEYIVVDTSNSFDDYTVAALDQSSSIFLISNTDLPSLRNAQRCLSIFERMGYNREKIHLLINRYQKSLEIRAKDIEETLNFPVYWFFPNDWPTIINSVNSGVPLSTVNHTEIAGSFTEFVQRVAKIQPAKPADKEKKKGLFGLFGR